MMRLFCLALIIACLHGSAAAQNFAGSAGKVPSAGSAGKVPSAGPAPKMSPQRSGPKVPSNVIAPEDPGFDAYYAGHRVPTVTGRLLNLPADELQKLSIKCTLVTPFSQDRVQQTRPVVIQPDGSFAIQLDYPLPYQQIWFNIDSFINTALYANSGLFVELDMKKLKAAGGVDFNGDGVRFSGADGPLNTYVNDYVLFKRPEKESLNARIMAMFPRMLSDSVLTAYREIFDSMRIIQNSYTSAHPSPFSWILENERLSDYYGDILVKHWGRTMNDSLWQQIRKHKSYLTSNSGAFFYLYLVTYINFLPGHWRSTGWKDIAGLPDLDAAEKALIDSLRTGEQLLADTSRTGQLQQPAGPYTTESIKKWKSRLQPRIQRMTLMRNFDIDIRLLDSLFPTAKADFLKMKLNAGTSLSDQECATDHISRTSHTSWCRQAMSSEHDKLMARINTVDRELAGSAGGAADSGFGRPLMRTSFGASLYDASGLKAAALLASLKQSFPGKALIIDRWATWCVPCLDEMAHSKVLQQESADLPVVFVYLCTTSNSSEEKWKEKVAELKQPGIHILIDTRLDAEISSLFSFGGYPGYAFIDRSGNYRGGAFQWLNDIKDRDALQALLR